jgi:pimeloyl-ACP methyl ester carboxylesterase
VSAAAADGQPWLLRFLAVPEPSPHEPASKLPHPLLLLPGMLGDADVWSDVATALEPRWDPRIGRIDVDDSVTGLAESVLAAAPPRFALAGHSLGGIVALELVRREPHRVTHLVLCNTSARAPSPAQLEGWAGLRRSVEDGAFEEVAASLARELLPPSRRDDPVLLRRARRSAAAVGPHGFRRQLAAQASRVDLRPTLTAIAVPTLVIAGEQDHLSPPALQEELAAGITQAEHEVLADVGHMAPVEAPADLADLLNRWDR